MRQDVGMDTTPGAAPGLSPPGTRSQHWLARLSFVLAGLAIVILLVFAGLKSLAMLAVARGRRGGEPGGRLLVPVPAGRAALAVARGLRPGADRGDRRLRVQGPAVGGARVGRGLAARGRDRARGPGRGPAGLAHARAPGAAARPAPVPDHEPEVRRREGREVRPETQGRRPRRRGVPVRRVRAGRRGRGGPAGRGRGRRPARRRRRRRYAGPGGRASPPSTACRSW